MYSYYYIVNGEMTLVDCSPEWDGNVRNEDYTWLIKKVYEATGHRIKRRDCGFVSKVNDMRAKELAEEDKDYEVYVQTKSGEIGEHFGPYNSYEECVEFIKENYTQENINDDNYFFQIEVQEGPGYEFTKYRYP